MKTRRELKADAKAILKGRWKDSVLMCLVPTLISIAILVITILIVIIPIATLAQNGNYMTDPASNATGGGAGGNSGGMIGGLISTIFAAGISWTFLDILRGRKNTIQPFKDVFRGFAGPFLLGVVCIYFLSSIFTFLWLLLFIIPGIIKAYSYSQAYFVYYDTYEATGTRPGFLDCITASRRLMKGHKLELFVLDLSFLGWQILALLTLGIGNLWLTPYMSATKAAFYENLPKNAI